MLDSVTLTQGTAASSTLLGVVGVVTAPDIQAMGLSVVAVVGGLLSLVMAAYGNYRKINKEYGVDDIKSANAKLDALEKQNQRQNEIIAQQSTELLELMKVQNQLLSQLNKSTETVAASTAVSAEVAVQQQAVKPIT
jgi:Tfp pilus assembly protein PilE